MSVDGYGLVESHHRRAITQDAPEVFSYDVQWESLEDQAQINVPVHPGLVVRRAVSPEQFPAVLQLVGSTGWQDLYQVRTPANGQILSIYYWQSDNPPQLPSTPVQQPQQQPPARSQHSRPELATLQRQQSVESQPQQSGQTRRSLPSVHETAGSMRPSAFTASECTGQSSGSKRFRGYSNLKVRTWDIILFHVCETYA